MLPARLRVTRPLPWFLLQGGARQHQGALRGARVRGDDAAANEGPHARGKAFGDAAGDRQGQPGARIDGEGQVLQRGGRLFQQADGGRIARLAVEHGGCKLRELELAGAAAPGLQGLALVAAVDPHPAGPAAPDWRGRRRPPGRGAPPAVRASRRCLRHPREIPIRRL
jgi:hypothetical protein